MNKKWSTGLAAALISLLTALGWYNKPNPNPQPTPSPTVEATVTPQPTVLPSSTPTPAPITQDCSKIEETDAKWVDKPTTPSYFRENVREWQNEIAKDYVVGDYVTSEEEYMNAIVTLALSKGFKVTNCFVKDEVWVAGPGFSEHYDLVTGDGLVWNHYAALATPEKFRKKTE